MIRKYGWKGPGPANWTLPTYAIAAPVTVDHVDRLSVGRPMDDQGQLGSCVGNAYTKAIEVATGCEQLSRLMAYFLPRIPEATQDVDAGAIIADAVTESLARGICRESVWPYDISKFAMRPSLDAFADAKATFPKIKPQRVMGLNAIKHALVSGYPVVFGFSVPSYFEEDEVRDTGWVRLPTAHDRYIGGHCVFTDGFDARRGVQEPFFWCPNSYGNLFGDAGYIKLPFRWFTDQRRLVDDLWAIVPA